MTQEDKELLFKDLCARLPYKVKCQIAFDEEDIHIETLESVSPTMLFNQVTTSGSVVSIENVKPYLRPMLSMAEEEREEWADLFIKPICELEQYFDEKEAQYMAPVLFGKSHSISADWLLSKGFDVRGLIPKGLALEAPEDMYKLNEK